MKTRNVLMTIMALGVTFASMAQTLENDDVYFTSKDRALLSAKRAQAAKESSTEVLASNRGTTTASPAEETAINPTDSYSARNVNPEFTSRSSAQVAQADNQDYFLNNYQYSTASDLNNWNNNFSSWYGNSWYTPAYYGSNINSWNSPYYGYNDPYSSPWYNPYYYSNGWSASYSYYSGNPYGYGYGGAYNYWNRPYCGGGYGSAWGPSVGWGSYNYPTVIVVNNSDVNGRAVVHGKRGTIGSSMVYNRQDRQIATGGRDRSTTVTTRPDQGTGSTGGRIASTNSTGTSSSNRREEYYNRSWRTTTTEPSTSTPARSSSSNTWSTWGGSGSGSSSSSSTSRTFDTGRSSSSSSPSYTPSSSGSRSSGSSSSSSGSSSGGSRGRTRD